MSKRWLFLLAGLGTLGTTPAHAQDIEAGRMIAQTWCSRCHAVDAQSHGAQNDAVPSFLAIAKMSSTTQMPLTVFLSTSHGRMPDFSLTRTEIRNVSAYILSLRGGY